MKKKTYLSPAVPMEVAQLVIDKAEAQGCEVLQTHIVPLQGSKLVNKPSIGMLILFTREYDPDGEYPEPISIDLDHDAAPRRGDISG